VSESLAVGDAVLTLEAHFRPRQDRKCPHQPGQPFATIFFAILLFLSKLMHNFFWKK
jgi:hypothetical protein